MVALGLSLAQPPLSCGEGEIVKGARQGKGLDDDDDSILEDDSSSVESSC